MILYIITVSSLLKPISFFRGWKDGDGLGKGNEGRTEPIKAEERPNRQGLGANNSVSKLAFNPSSKRMELNKKTQERFNSLS